MNESGLKIFATNFFDLQELGERGPEIVRAVYKPVRKVNRCILMLISHWVTIVFVCFSVITFKIFVEFLVDRLK
ncbi:MAG: hypothetical protein RIQ94_166 [Pseudomonadota bacterium]|jgi:hypothetical protein